MSKEKKKALWVDENTHMEFAVLAARKKVSIKQYLKELVEREKSASEMLSKIGAEND